MDLSTLLQYLSDKASDREREAVEKWLDADPDGSHFELFSDAHDIFNSITLHSQSSAPVVAAAAQIAPARVAPALKRRRRAAVWGYASFAAAAVLAVFVGLHFGEQKVRSELAAARETLSVPVGKYLEFTFEDGTTAWLNSGTQISYPKAFGKDRRGITLEKGEILLDVTKDEARPFVVETFAADIKVYGTRLDVIAEPEEGTFKTALFRGSVGVIPKQMEDTEFMLYPNQSLSLGPEDGFVKESFSKNDAIDSWISGLLNIAGLDFETLMAKIEKAFGTSIIIDTEQIPQLDIRRGKVRINDGIDHALDVIKLNHDFNYIHDYNSNTITIY